MRFDYFVNELQPVFPLSRHTSLEIVLSTILLPTSLDSSWTVNFTLKMANAEIYVVYQVSLKKSGTLDFCYFDIRKYIIFWFHQIKHCLLKKKLYQDHWNWFSSFDFVVISHKCSHCQMFSLFSWHFSQGLWLFWLPYIVMIVAGKPIDPCKQKMTVSRNGCRINTTKQNQMILVSYFSEDVLFNEIRICYIFKYMYQSNENQAFRFCILISGIRCVFTSTVKKGKCMDASRRWTLFFYVMRVCLRVFHQL